MQIRIEKRANGTVDLIVTATRRNEGRPHTTRGLRQEEVEGALRQGVAKVAAPEQLKLPGTEQEST